MKINNRTVTTIIVSLIVVASIALLVTTLSSDGGKDAPVGQSTQSTKLDTLGVEELIKNNESYKEKEIYLKGVIAQHSQGYSIYDRADSSTGIRLALPSSFDIKNYAATEGGGLSRPVTAQGKLSTDKTSGNAVFVVTSVK